MVKLTSVIKVMSPAQLVIFGIVFTFAISFLTALSMHFVMYEPPRVADNDSTQPVGPGTNYVLRSSAPLPAGSARTWTRDDDQLMQTTSANVDVPSMGGTVLTSDAAITQYMIVKAATTASRVTPLLAGDSSVLLAGVALNGTAAGALPVVVSVPGFPTLVLNDGTGIIVPGDIIEPSPTVNGHVHEGATDPVCVAMTGAAASVGATFLCR